MARKAVTSDVQFEDLYNSLDEAGSSFMWQYVAQRVKAKVKGLMNKGIDVNGTKYKRYSRAYRELRVEKGKRRTPNLQWSSKMWKSIQARHTADYFEIYITGAEENLKAEWNIKARDFFSWGTETHKAMDKGIDTYLKKAGF